MTDSAVVTRRLKHFTPLRYPGGKAKLAPFIKQIIECNDLEDGCYVEPFAGGAAIATQLLMQGYVSQIIINDLSPPIYAFWLALKTNADRFIDSILNVELSVDEWDRQKATLRGANIDDPFALGFSAFYLNRTNRSGVLNGGIIGGRAQTGEWLIDARFNRDELAFRVQRLSSMADRIDVRCMDAVDFLDTLNRTAPSRSLVYADPPYYAKGRQLYLDYYNHADHEDLASFLTGSFLCKHWLVSYDDTPEIRRIYSDQRTSPYAIPYSARNYRLGHEVMFYSPELRLPSHLQTGAEIGPADRFTDVLDAAIC